ncbi:diversity-generating retroelement protein Avd [Thermodesulfovibrio sp.]|uniref:diversity-generating retroelement protein Avd n=1 Tax=Thermodesulfovibrio sp. TaxID=2067987 RepID=UPI0030B745E1
MNNLILYQKVYDFMLYIFPIIDKFPKYEKFALCTHIKSCVLEIMREIIRANKSRNKRPILYDIDVKLEELRCLLKFAHDRKYLSHRSFEHSSKLLSEIGKILGGWIKSVG